MKIELRGLFEKKELYLVPETLEEEALIDQCMGERVDEGQTALHAVRYYGMGQHYFVLAKKETP